MTKTENETVERAIRIIVKAGADVIPDGSGAALVRVNPIGKEIPLRAAQLVIFAYGINLGRFACINELKNSLEL